MADYAPLNMKATLAVKLERAALFFEKITLRERPDRRPQQT